MQRITDYDQNRKLKMQKTNFLQNKKSTGRNQIL